MIRTATIGVMLLALLSGIAFPQQIIGSCPILPANNIWNTPVDTLPLLANSTILVNTIGASTGFHADFGSGMWNGGPIGIPFITVPGSQTKYPASFFYDDESDPGPYAIPLDAPIEGGSNSNGDRHAIAIDTDNCLLYELYRAFPQSASWNAGSGAIFDLKSNALRPLTWTSADAAGLPIMPGLVTIEEVLSGEIRHAIRFTAPETRRAFVWPARHYASDLTDAKYPRMGERFRLKASFDISPYPTEVQVILRAMKKYGIILADNGSAWFISGKPDPRWNNDNLRSLHNLLGSNFEAVDATVLRITDDSGEALQPGYEGDTSPRPAGDNSLSLADWVQTGRLVTGLDSISPGEFQRADCSPRETRGNGVLSLADWVQAGRYGANIDPPTPIGGPASPGAPAASFNNHLVTANRFVSATSIPVGSVTVVASTVARTQLAKATVWLDAVGIENAIGFTASFDGSQWEFLEAKAESDMLGAALIVNEKELGSSRIGIAVALPPAQAAQSGWRSVVALTFRRTGRTSDRAPVISLTADEPVQREVVDVWGNVMKVDWRTVDRTR